MTLGWRILRPGGSPEVVAAYEILIAVGAGLILVLPVPSWAALLIGVAVALGSGQPLPVRWKKWTSKVLQIGVVALGAGMNLAVVLKVGAEGAGLTAVSLALALGTGWLIGKVLKVPADTSLMLSVGTAICGGSAIAAVASVIKPKAHEMSVALGVVFLLNGLALLVFPPFGHALGLGQAEFGRFAALAIHDTSSVVGAGLAYGPEALDVATTTKLARALWIVPLTIGVAVWRQRGQGGGLKGIKWPYFIIGFLGAAALFTWVPELAPVKPWAVLAAKRILVLALFLVGLGLSREALKAVGWRPMAQGVLLWFALIGAALFLAR